MDSFNDFLKNFSVEELKENKPNGKSYWVGKEKDSSYQCTGLTKLVILDTIKKAWASHFARTYHDKGKWWVGEKGSRKGFKTEEVARNYQAKLIRKYGAN